jgi:hypothetical protein
MFFEKILNKGKFFPEPFHQFLALTIAEDLINKGG